MPNCWIFGNWMIMCERNNGGKGVTGCIMCSDLGERHKRFRNSYEEECHTQNIPINQLIDHGIQAKTFEYVNSKYFWK